MAEIEGPQCSICLETIEGPGVTPRCPHLFHKACLAAMVKCNRRTQYDTAVGPDFVCLTNRCPNCRKIFKRVKTVVDVANYVYIPPKPKGGEGSRRGRRRAGIPNNRNEVAAEQVQPMEVASSGGGGPVGGFISTYNMLNGGSRIAEEASDGDDAGGNNDILFLAQYPPARGRTARNNNGPRRQGGRIGQGRPPRTPRMSGVVGWRRIAGGGGAAPIIRNEGDTAQPQVGSSGGGAGEGAIIIGTFMPSYTCRNCAICGRGRFRSTSAVHHHMDSHTGTKFGCPRCGRKYIYRNGLRQHRRIHRH